MTTTIHLNAPDALICTVTISATLGELRRISGQMEAATHSWNPPLGMLILTLKESITKAEQEFTTTIEPTEPQ